MIITLHIITVIKLRAYAYIIFLGHYHHSHNKNVVF